MATAKTAATTGGPDAMFRAYLANGEFRLQRFAGAGFVFPPRQVCPASGSREYTWERPSGRGTVYSTTVIRRKAELGGDYGIVLVDLDEGPRMLSQVAGMAPQAVRIGQRVRAKIADIGGQQAVVFEAAEA